MAGRKLASTENQRRLNASGGDEYEPYRLAGELFARLRQELGFGDLELFMRAQPDSRGAAVFQWRFNADVERYCCESEISLSELENLRSCEWFAADLAERWKNKVRFLKDGEGS